MIYVGCDHGGFDLKETVIDYLEKNNIDFTDVGCYNKESVDYPDVAKEVCTAIIEGRADKGILLCGTGIGISIAANKFKGIRAAICSDTYCAKFSRLHNDANVLCLGGRVLGPGLAREIIDVFLTTDFEGKHHIDRLLKIQKIENER
ncbi:MAG: ribose 5-phosphate isomerase B [Clostridia bacterium]|nr:ribose 5-phosphate isomerase B [Clostridia bacterium]